MEQIQIFARSRNLNLANENKSKFTSRGGKYICTPVLNAAGQAEI